MSIWECDICQVHFNVENARAAENVKNNLRKMCGAECFKKWRKEYGSKNVTDWVSKNGHPRLTKGSGITTDGYVWVFIKGRGYCHNQIKLHRYLMEVKLGRRLSSDEIVHHIDENKLNNNIDNLEIHTRTSHNKLHRKLEAERRG